MKVFSVGEKMTIINKLPQKEFIKSYFKIRKRNEGLHWKNN